MIEQARILVVDDEDLMRIGVQRILSRAGYAVTEAASAQQALDTLRQQRFELVITDLQMPGMDGFELLQELKQRGSQLPVLMLTGHGSMETVVQALRHGVNDFLAKPYQPEELLSIVEREVARYRRSLPPGATAELGVQVPVSDLERLDQLLAELRAEISARCVLLVEGNGSVIASKGALQEINVGALAALVAGDFAATVGIASLIGESDAFKLNYHEGKTYNVYSAQIIPGVFLLIIFSQEIKLGVVMYYARQVLEDAQGILKRAAAASPPRPDAPALPPVPAPVPAPSEPCVAATLNAPPQATPPSPAPEPEPEPANQELFSLDQMITSGLLDPGLLDSLDEQFKKLWGE